VHAQGGEQTETAAAGETRGQSLRQGIEVRSIHGDDSLLLKIGATGETVGGATSPTSNLNCDPLNTVYTRLAAFDTPSLRGTSHSSRISMRHGSAGAYWQNYGFLPRTCPAAAL